MNRKSTTAPSETTFDWTEFDALTEEQVHAAALADPDAQPTTPEQWLKARIRLPDGRILEKIPVDRDVSDWLRRDLDRRTRPLNDKLRQMMDDEAA